MKSADKSPFQEREKIAENTLAYAIYDAYPVAEGHALVVPVRIFSSYLDATEEEKRALWELVDKVCTLLKEKEGVEGFNIGINVGEAAGQTVGHMHIHVIPRRKGDTQNPRGGVRGVIPGKQSY